MSTTETRTELRQGVDGIDWRHFWLKNVMIDSGKLAPTKIARRELQKNAQSRRLRKLHRTRAILGPR
jgi:hypothetical protein